MNARALVLNAAYQPINVVPTTRAVVLVLGGKAEVVEEADDYVRSATLQLPVPRVIRLFRMVTIPYRRRVPITRRTVLARDRGSCGYCGSKATTVDHIRPRSQGGRHEWRNVVAACESCNHRKGPRTPSEAKMPLRVMPTEPEGPSAIEVLIGKADDAWVVWLRPK